MEGTMPRLLQRNKLIRLSSKCVSAPRILHLVDGGVNLRQRGWPMMMGGKGKGFYDKTFIPSIKKERRTWQALLQDTYCGIVRALFGQRDTHSMGLDMCITHTPPCQFALRVRAELREGQRIFRNALRNSRFRIP